MVVPTKAVRTLLRARACGERTQVVLEDVEGFEKRTAAAAFEVEFIVKFVGPDLELECSSVVLRGVLLLRWLGKLRSCCVRHSRCRTKGSHGSHICRYQAHGTLRSPQKGACPWLAGIRVSQERPRVRLSSAPALLWDVDPPSHDGWKAVLQYPPPASIQRKKCCRVRC